jgi:hypothetical protein
LISETFSAAGTAVAHTSQRAKHVDAVFIAVSGKLSLPWAIYSRENEFDGGAPVINYVNGPVRKAERA